MVGLKSVAQDSHKLDIAVAERAASMKFRAGSAIEAAELVQRELDPRNIAANSDKGWFVQLAANYCHASDPARAQEMQLKSYDWNPALFRPVAGVRYQKIIAKSGIQAQNTLAWIRSHTDPNAITVSVESLINSLAFGTDPFRFEAAWCHLGRILGFVSQRPERELGKGPDGLWALPDGHYLLTEIKNDVEETRTEIQQDETEQLSNHTNWFRTEYGKSVPVVPLFVHQTAKLANSAYPPEGTMVMTPTKLEQLHTRLRGFAEALAAKPSESWTSAEVGTLIASHRLDAGSVRTVYCLAAKR